MTIADAWPKTGRAFTVDDLDRTPDDGRRYELVDGTLIVSPAPAVAHQVVLHKLQVQLEAACPGGLAVVPGPGLRMSGSTELIPDVVVVKLADLAGPHLITPPMLAVEVRSPGTALFDLNTKKAAYERFGVRSYWIVVPDPDQPELTAFELRDGRYEVVAQVAGDTVFGTELPFAVEVVPSRLVASLPKG
jgi:Uma2 family endonuclease